MAGGETVGASCPYSLGGNGRYTSRSLCSCGRHDLITIIKNCDYEELQPDVINASSHVTLYDHSVRVDHQYKLSLISRSNILNRLGKAAGVPVIPVNGRLPIPTLTAVREAVDGIVRENTAHVAEIDKLRNRCKLSDDESKRSAKRFNDARSEVRLLRARVTALESQLESRPVTRNTRVSKAKRRISRGLVLTRRTLLAIHPDKSACASCASGCVDLLAAKSAYLEARTLLN